MPPPEEPDGTQSAAKPTKAGESKSQAPQQQRTNPPASVETSPPDQTSPQNPVVIPSIDTPAPEEPAKDK